MRRVDAISRHVSPCVAHVPAPSSVSSTSAAHVPRADFLDLQEAIPGPGQDLSPGMRAGFVTLRDGQRIFFVVSGDGAAGVPLLCVPGAMGTALTDFRSQLEGLANGSRAVISFDPRGYGRSRPPTRFFTPDFYHRDAEDAFHVMEALGHRTFDLLGWSDGGNSSVLLSAKYPAHVRRLVVFGSNSCVTQKDLEGFEKSRNVAKDWSAGMKATHLPIYGDELQKLWDSFCDVNVEIVRAGGDVCQEQAKAVRCKTLILHGEKDPLVGSEHPQFYLSVIPGSTYHGFAEGKHNIHIKYHSEFNAVVHAFLAKED